MLVWIAVTAVIISAVLAFDRTIRNDPPSSLLLVSFNTLTAIAVAGALTIAVFGVQWKRNGYPFPTQPGEEFLLLLVLGSVGFAVIIVVSLGAFSISHDLFPIVVLYCGLVMLGGWLAVGRCAFRAHRYEPLAWRIVFWFLAVLPILAAIFEVTLVMRLAAAVVAVVAWNDWRLRPARPWTHWFGVVMLILFGVTGGSAFLVY